MKKILLLIGAIYFSTAALALANGLGGQRLEKSVGQYTVDIGTDQEFTPQAGAPVRFDFQLLNGANQALLPYTDVNVSLTQDGKPMVDSDIVTARSGPTLFTYTFPTAGTYQLEVMFYDKDKLLAQAEFPLTIAGETMTVGTAAATGGGRALLFGIVLGVVGGGLLGLFLARVFGKKAAV